MSPMLRTSILTGLAVTVSAYAIAALSARLAKDPVKARVTPRHTKRSHIDFPPL